MFKKLLLPLIIISSASNADAKDLPNYNGQTIDTVSMIDFTSLGFEHIVNGKYYKPMTESKLVDLYESALSLELDKLDRNGASAFEVNRIKQEHTAHINLIKTEPFGQKELPKIVKVPVRFEFDDDDYDFEKEKFTICMQLDGDDPKWRNDWGFQKATKNLPYSKNGIEFKPMVMFEIDTKKTCYSHPVPVDQAENYTLLRENFGRESGYRGYANLIPYSIRLNSYDFSSGIYPKVYFAVYNIKVDDGLVK